MSNLERLIKQEDITVDPLGLWSGGGTGQYLLQNFEGFEVPTQSPDSNLSFLLKNVENINNGKVVEVGVFGGYVSLNLAKALKDKNTNVYSIDIWENQTMDNGNMTYKGEVSQEYLDDAKHWFKHMRINFENIVKELEYENLEIIQKPSLIAVNDFKDNEIDLIFIDSDHSTEHVYNELDSWLPKIKPNGVIIGDDFNDNRVRAAIEKFAKDRSLTFEVDSGRCWKVIK